MYYVKKYSAIYIAYVMESYHQNKIGSSIVLWFYGVIVLWRVIISIKYGHCLCYGRLSLAQNRAIAYVMTTYRNIR